MKHLIIIFCLSLSIFSFGQNNNLVEKDLLGCWTDSMEENTQHSDIGVYRPCDFKSFPLSRFRFAMVLEKGNTCSWLYCAPNDAHRMKAGTWTFNKETMILKIFNTDKEEVKSFVISEIGKNILKIKINN